MHVSYAYQLENCDTDSKWCGVHDGILEVGSLNKVLIYYGEVFEGM